MQPQNHMPWLLAMASSARSTLDRIVFVDAADAQASARYAQDREVESRLSLESLGVAADRQTYLHLPDTKLVKYTGTLALGIARHALHYNLSDYYTLGQSGYDNHPDHIATHQAAAIAQTLLSRTQPIRIWELSPDGSADITVNAGHTPKLGALAFHQTQMPLRRDPLSGELCATDQRHWDKFIEVYGQVLFNEERYKLTDQARYAANLAVRLSMQPA